MIDKLIEILKQQISNFEIKQVKGTYYFTCPNVHRYKKDKPTAILINNNQVIYCLECGYKKSVKDLIAEYNFVKFADNVYPELDLYHKLGFSLIKLGKNAKVPIDKWTENHIKDKQVWLKWLSEGNNLGCPAGEINKITVIDIDVKTEISPEVKQERDELICLLEKSATLTQITPTGGKHYIFQYDSDIPQLQRNVNSKRKIDLMSIDIRNKGGYIVVAPSQLNNNRYYWLDLNAEIKLIPEELKQKLLNFIKTENQNVVIEPKVEEVKIVKEGEGRNNLLISLGGVFSNMFNINQTAEILNAISQTFFNPPLPKSEIMTMLKQLEKYRNSDELTKEIMIYDYLRMVQSDVSAKDVMEYTGLPRSIVDKYLSKFVKEGKAIRLGRGRFRYREKVEWTNAVKPVNGHINYQIPYFDDLAHFYSGDIIIVGGKTSAGKTHLAMNFIEQFKEQGIKPYYIPLEAGARHYKISETLGLNENDYFVPTIPIINPLSIEIEPNSVTIIDWLLIQEKEHTDTIFKYLSDEMIRKGGILIIFVQLKENNEYFAPNMILQFCRFAARYIIDSDDGTLTHFQVDKITDPKGNIRNYSIPCQFDFNTKIIKRL